MIEKKIFVLLPFFLLSLFALPVRAQEDNQGITIINKNKTEVINRATATANSTEQEVREETRQYIQEENQQIIRERQEVRQEIREKVNEQVQTRLRNLSGIFLNRLSNLTDRLNVILGRIESRLEKIKQQDETIDTTEIEIVLQNAKQDLKDAESKIADLSMQLDSFIELETDPFQGVSEAKNSFAQIRDLLLSVRKDLVQTIGLMKGLRVNN